ncbi:MAG: hypothetical protein JO037_14380 [Actinobacteria bacterium]|nr:hypothetical protein [Actinomycetota bacterium]
MRPAHLVPAALALAALGALAGAARLGQPAATGTNPGVTVARPVNAAVRACPPAPGGGQAVVALIAAAREAAGTPGAPAHSGLAELTALSPAGVASRALRPVRSQDAGVLSLLTVPAGASAGNRGGPVPVAWSVTAGGTMAQAMEAEVADGSGLAGVRCGEPGSDLWFLGPGQRSGAARIQLDLMNVDSAAASVDAGVITDAGQVQAGDLDGITVPPHQTVTESLSPASAGSSVVAIEVRTSAGRVAADVSESSSPGGPASWLPRAAPPSTQLVIPGVPPSGRGAGLYLAVPGSSSARVDVLAITAQGRYRPFGSQPVELPGQSASYVALTSFGGAAAALQITSNVPVAAAAGAPGSGAGAFTAAAPPILEQAVVAGNTTGSGLAASVALSAPAAAARVRLTEIAQAGRNGAVATSRQAVLVRAGRTLAVPVTGPPGAAPGSAFAVVISPLAGSGPVYAARVETRGQPAVLSVLPAVSALTTLSLPPVRDSYDAISP